MLATLGTPTLILTGDKDQIIPFEKAKTMAVCHPEFDPGNH